MKKILSFGSGFVAGIITTILVVFLIQTGNQPVANRPNDGLDGLRLFSKKGEIITRSEIEVFQVLKPNMALARTGKYSDEIVVLLINYDGKSYYDDQKIKIPADKCARQIGIYQYTSKRNMDKTVPAVVIEKYNQKKGM
jgi:hypothetical protein